MTQRGDEAGLTASTAEEGFPEGEHLHTLLFAMVPDVIYRVSADGTVAALSPAFESMTGWSVDQWLGQPFAGLVHPDDLPLSVEMFKATLRGEIPAPFELRIRSKSGAYLVGEFRGRPQIEHGRVVGKIGVARDITERKRVENSLRFLAEASAALAASLDFETTLSNVARLAVPEMADWCIVDVVEENASIRRLAVVHADPAKEELAGELQRRYPPMPGGDRGVASVIESRQARLVEEITDDQLARRARDPQHLAILQGLGFRSAMIVPLVARNRSLGAITFVSAESGRRYGRSDLSVAEDLGRRAATAVDNARLYRAAQQALQLREEFLSIASHELKTPLTALQLQIQVLRRAVSRLPWETPGFERSLGTLDAAQRQVKRLSRLINDLLDVSRIAGGRLELERDEVDLSQVVRDAAARFEEELHTSGSRLTIVADAPVVGHWDRFRLDQVVTNLLSNAIKYGQGQPIDVTASSDGSTACLSVRDRGMGIASDDVDRIFDRFERAASGQQTAGLGLGLYICRQLVEAHGGAIRVSSKPGSGSTFEVALPLEPPS